MGKLFGIFPRSVLFLLTDKVSLFFSLIPLTVGLVVYSFFFRFLHDFVSGKVTELLGGYIDFGGFWGGVVEYTLLGLLAIFGFFIVNWTFVLFVGLIGSPFYEMISERLEKSLKGEKPDGFGLSLKRILKSFLFTILNESKKVFVIVLLSLVAFITGYIPVLTPISLALTFLLVAIQFLDYFWSRNDVPAKECFRFCRSNIILLILSGAMFFVVINIPFLNLMVPAVATVYYSIFIVES